LIEDSKSVSTLEHQPVEKSFEAIARAAGRTVAPSTRPVVCVQGLGFVGSAMAIAVAHAKDRSEQPCFNVIGVDLPTPQGLTKIAALNAATLSFKTTDPQLMTALSEAHTTGNLIATSDTEAYAAASIVIVDVHLDVDQGEGGPSLPLDGFRAAIRTVGERIAPGCLVIIETTVAPGTCEKVVGPELTKTAVARGLAPDSFLLAHAYERVMPGKEYFDSIVNYWRVYAGATPDAADACEKFLSQVIDVKNYPLTRLASPTASETAKVLENSYRATTIAFMEEWSRFAEAIGIDLFDVISAIRMRPTHSNIRQPGFGVGGYCLTKDPLLAEIGARELFELENIQFPFCNLALATNSTMSLGSLDKVEAMLGGIEGKSLLLLGVSYRADVGDTRYSPSEVFASQARAKGANVTCFDPFVDYWVELDEQLPSELPTPRNVDAVIFAVSHEQYRNLDIKKWLDGATPAILDANNVLTKQQRDAFTAAKCNVATIGRGDGL
jgi:nucleotide sugar dehydrogenase